ncbi:hypothetical protein C7293_17070 [filamentous cyanobacterium CCT1]|nr:hypothetical protein C7293_17070 [filamentous cyanobacterium CCT1]PSN79878.1 hypothetical protein C8B47_09420 [filamentous cyanobacterium CCP4]
MNNTLQDWAQTATELRHQIRPLCTNNPRFVAIDQKLVQILETIEQKNLSLQIFSQAAQQADGVVKFLVTQPDLAAICRVFTAPQPKTWSLDPSLVAPALRFNRPSQQFLSLNQTQTYTLGRGEHCSLQVDDSYLFVSSEHCHIEYDRSMAAWTIEDTSRNGTFINGERLSQKVGVRSGDHIVLGSENLREHSFELWFDDPFNRESKAKPDSSLIDFDLACFGFTLDQGLTESDRQQLDEVRKLVKTNLYGLIDVNAIDSADTPFTKEFAKAFIDSLSKGTKISSSRLGYADLRFAKRLGSDLERVSVPESPLDRPNPDLSKTKYTFQACLHTILQNFQENCEALLLKRLKPQIEHLKALIDRLSAYEASVVSKPLQLNLLDQKRQNSAYLNLQAQQALYLIKSQSEAFFKQAENYLNQAEKADNTFFDELCVDSLSYKMQVFSRLLTPHVSKRGNKKLLQLKYVSANSQLLEPQPEQRDTFRSEPSKVIDANTAMLNFCEYELYLWAKKVWHEIYLNLASGGLKSLHDKVFTALELISIKELSAIKEQYDICALDLHVLSNSSQQFTQAPDETVIKEPSALSYLMKKVRSQWMQFIFLFSFFSILGIAGRRQIMRNLMSPIISLFGKAPIISGLVLIGLIFVGVKFGLRVYQEDLEEARSKQGDDLRLKLCKHYQELAKKHLMRSYLKIVKMKLKEEQDRIENIQSHLENLIKTSVQEFK